MSAPVELDDEVKLILHASRILARHKRGTFGGEWAAEWLAARDMERWGDWFHPSVFPPIAFADWNGTATVEQAKGKAANEQALLVAVWEVVAKAIETDADPDKLDTCGILLGTGRNATGRGAVLDTYWGRLVLEDYILSHSDLRAFGSEVDKALDKLAEGGWIRRAGYLRPHEELNELTLRADTLKANVPPIAACEALAGDANAGKLLLQARYWGHRKIRRPQDNLQWVVKTRAQWMQETNLSLNQYNRALSILKARGLVETEQHIDRRGTGKSQTHLRLVTYIVQGPRCSVSK